MKAFQNTVMFVFTEPAQKILQGQRTPKMETQIISVWITASAEPNTTKNPLFHIIYICQRVYYKTLEWKRGNNYMELEQKMRENSYNNCQWGKGEELVERKRKEKTKEEERGRESSDGKLLSTP